MACERPFVFKHPFSMLIAGPTMSGKTCFIIDLLSQPSCISPPPKKILWCYGIRNDEQFLNVYRASKYPVHFKEGLPNVEDISPDDGVFIIIDDLMLNAGKSEAISQLFTLGMHHKNISVALIVQNIFHQGKKMRDISLNTKYFVLFKNPRDRRQISFLSSQMFPAIPNFLPDAFQQATERPHGYLIIDLTQQTNENHRLVTNIFPHQQCYFFMPIKKI